MIVPQAERLQAVDEYYFATKLREIKEMETAGRRIINLGIGSPDIPPSPETIERLRASAADGRHYMYQPYKGIPELRAAIAGYMREHYHCTLDPGTEILPLPGSKQGMLYVTLAFVNPGDGVLVPDPGYPTYPGVARMCGARVLSYPLDPDNGWAPDWRLLDRMDLRNVKLMWANYPHMPTGAPARRSTFEALVKFALERRILLCHDNPYSQLGGQDELLSMLTIPRAREVVIELQSMSKSHNLSGLRIGWAAGAREYIDAVTRIASNVESGMPLPLQHAAIAALKSGRSWYERLRAEYGSRRRQGERILEGLGCAVEPGQAGMFVWGKILDPAADAEALADRVLKEAHVFIVPGTVFGPRGAGHLRLSLCSPVDVLTEAEQWIHQSLGSMAGRTS